MGAGRPVAVRPANEPASLAGVLPGCGLARRGAWSTTGLVDTRSRRPPAPIAGAAGSIPYYWENLRTAPIPSTKAGVDRELEHLTTDPGWAAGYRRARARSEQTEMVRRAIESER